MRPAIFRTHDGGRTWARITAGLPDGAPVNAVREDPGRKGLLYAATEHEVHVSFDDGGHWQSLRLNMPATSVRDLIVKGDDLAVATHGRGFWILDDVTPLRQLSREAAEAEAFLFKPQTATRVRWNMGTDTPLPPDEPAGENPPDGAVLHYALKSNAAGPLTLEILDAAGRVVRRYSGSDTIVKLDPATVPVPIYWYRPPQILSGTAGLHRFLWDMRYQPLAGAGGRGGGLPIAATPYNTVPTPSSIWAPPGTYTVRLMVDGKAVTQPLTLRLDPRVKTPSVEIARVSRMSLALYDGVLWTQAEFLRLRALRNAVKPVLEKVGRTPAAQAIEAFDKKASTLEGGGGSAAPGQRGGGMPQSAAAAGNQDTLSGMAGSLTPLMTALQAADAAPPDALAAAVEARLSALSALKVRWEAFLATDLPALNARLKAEGLPPVELK